MSFPPSDLHYRYILFRFGEEEKSFRRQSSGRIQLKRKLFNLHCHPGCVWINIKLIWLNRWRSVTKDNRFWRRLLGGIMCKSQQKSASKKCIVNWLINSANISLGSHCSGADSTLIARIKAQTESAPLAIYSNGSLISIWIADEGHKWGIPAKYTKIMKTADSTAAQVED